MYFEILLRVFNCAQRIRAQDVSEILDFDILDFEILHNYNSSNVQGPEAMKSLPRKVSFSSPSKNTSYQFFFT